MIKGYILPSKPPYSDSEVRRIHIEFANYALYGLGRGELTWEEAYYIDFEWCKDNLTGGSAKTYQAATNPIYRRGLKGVLDARRKRRDK